LRIIKDRLSSVKTPNSAKDLRTLNISQGLRRSLADAMPKSIT